MTQKKTTHKKIVKSETKPRAKHTKKSTKTHVAVKETNPEFMVQVNEPVMLRKDLLESLREVIIFMQGYEKFRAVQEEKVALFSALQTNIKELKQIVEGKLQGYLPKGKLTPVTHDQQVQYEKREEAKQVKQVVEQERVPMSFPKTANAPAVAVVEAESVPNDLEQLESQLHDIESQLQNLQ